MLQKWTKYEEQKFFYDPTEFDYVKFNSAVETITKALLCNDFRGMPYTVLSVEYNPETQMHYLATGNEYTFRTGGVYSIEVERGPERKTVVFHENDNEEADIWIKDLVL
jgi:hypothetical protein